MELIWKLDKEEIVRLQQFVAKQSTNAFVRYRLKHNIETPPAPVTIEQFWYMMVRCLLTSQQRSGPESPIIRFLAIQPFPLGYANYTAMTDPEAEGRHILQAFGGIRFINRISQFLTANYRKLQGDLWEKTESVLERIRSEATPAAERDAAMFLAHHYRGVGPKQARNLLQVLKLARYEIPIDSRVIKWLNNFGFPVVLSATALADENYFNFVSDGIQAMCQQSDLFPCVLDAAIFSSYDGDAWTDENIMG